MKLRLLTAGESHGPALLAILDGLPAGLSVDISDINNELKRRQNTIGAGARMKIEQDRVVIWGGLMEGKTIGAPLALLIWNKDHARWRGKDIEAFTIPRPGHADLSGAIKYGLSDLRLVLERASARETVARVAAGAVCKRFLAEFGLRVAGYVRSIGPIRARYEDIPVEERVRHAEENPLSCPDPIAAEQMRHLIQQTIQDRDTLGGVIEVVAWNVPVGLGSYVQWDQRLEARLGAALLSVPAIKGVEVGDAFENTTLPGTQVHDGIRLEHERIVRKGNRAGGIEGGISNGEPIVLRAAMKPIATTLKPQPSVDLARGVEVDTKYERSDFCPVVRAVPILEAMVAFVLADALLEKLGGDSIAEMKLAFERLRKPTLSDLRLVSTPKMYWQEEKSGDAPSSDAKEEG